MRAIETPEGVDLELRVAGPYERAIAYVLDLLLRALFVIVAGILVRWLAGVGQALFTLLFFAVEWMYPVLFEVLGGGATPGKRAMGLVVLRADSLPVGWSQSVIRNSLRAVDMLPVGYAIGLLSMLESSRFQRIGDRVAGTVVVHRRGDLRREKLHKASPLAPQVALSLADQAAIVDFSARLGSWSKPRAIEIADNLAPLTGERGEVGVERTLALASWIGGDR